MICDLDPTWMTSSLSSGIRSCLRVGVGSQAKAAQRYQITQPAGSRASIWTAQGGSGSPSVPPARCLGTAGAPHLARGASPAPLALKSLQRGGAAPPRGLVSLRPPTSRWLDPARASPSSSRPPVVLLQQGGDLGVLVLQGAAVDLGRVRRQDDLHGLRVAQGVLKRGGGCHGQGGARRGAVMQRGEACRAWA